MATYLSLGSSILRELHKAKILNFLYFGSETNPTNYLKTESQRSQVNRVLTCRNVDYPKDQSGALNTVIYEINQKHTIDTLEEDLFVRSAFSEQLRELNPLRQTYMENSTRKKKQNKNHNFKILLEF